MLRVNASVSIPQSELRFVFSRSRGPGGRKLDTTETRVTVIFDADSSEALSAAQKRLLRERLGKRFARSGVLRVVSQKHRTQGANRREALERLASLLREGLERRRPRIPTRVPRSAVERRLAEKKRRSMLKRERSKDRRDED